MIGATVENQGPIEASNVKGGLPRVIEASLALMGLIVCAPLIGLAATAIRLTSRGPIIFRQQRVGLDGRLFTLYKLRTMYLRNQGPQVTAGGDSRVTPVGRVLRRIKLDEVPELWNIVKGEMGLVGPRPEVPRYVNLKANSMWSLVLKARPGVTDPVTLRLRNEETLLAGVPGDPERFYLETLQPFKLRGYAEYLQRRTWWSDTRILVATAVAVMLPGRTPPPDLEELRAPDRLDGRSTFQS